MMNQTEITNHERHESGVLGLPHATNLSDRATFHTRFIDLRTWHLRGQVSHLARWSRRSQGHVRQVRQFRKALATQAPRSQQSNQRLREIYRISVIRENSAAGSFLKDIQNTYSSKTYVYNCPCIYIYIYVIIFIYTLCILQNNWKNRVQTQSQKHEH